MSRQFFRTKLDLSWRKKNQNLSANLCQDNFFFFFFFSSWQWDFVQKREWTNLLCQDKLRFCPIFFQFLSRHNGIFHFVKSICPKKWFFFCEFCLTKFMLQFILISWNKLSGLNKQKILTMKAMWINGITLWRKPNFLKYRKIEKIVLTNFKSKFRTLKF